MLAFAWYLLKVLLCSGILFGYYWIALRNKKFHQYNRFYLLIAVALSWIIPLMRFDLITNEAEKPQMVKLLSVVSVGNEYLYNSAQKSQYVWDWSMLGMLAFAFVSAMLLARLFISLIRVRLIINNSITQKLDDIYLIFSNAKGTPFSFFKYIFWNESIKIDSPAGRHILRHELAHVQEKHSADKLFINLSLIAGWYNPFMWFIKKELNMIHEFIADQKAIKDGDTAAFASMILNAAYSHHQHAFANQFFYSPLKRRLLMLTSSKCTRFTYMRRLAILPLLIVTTFLFAFNLKKQNIDLMTDDNLRNSLLTPLRDLIGNNNNQSYAKTINQTSYDTIIKGQHDQKDVNATTNKGATQYKYPWRRVILDGQRMSWEEFEALNLPRNEFITVIFIGGENSKSGYAARFGDEAKNGLAIFTTKKIYEQTGVTTENGKKVIFTKDEKGKITTYTKDEAIVRFGFRPSDINAWFAKEDESRYVDTVPKVEKFDKVFTKVESPAAYKGNLSQYIAENLQHLSQANNKKIEGKVVIRFLVDEEGNLSDFKPLTSIGNGLEAEAIRLLKNSGPWKPAMQNGRKVVYEVKQEIDFTFFK